jgi:O-methyltransferase
MMNLTVFQTVNYLLILVLFVLFFRYMWVKFIYIDRRPLQWQHALERNMVSSQVRKLSNSYKDKARFFNWWFQIERLKAQRVPGVFVELGVYQGDSARVIHHMDPVRPFHLFDTFSGFTTADLRNETGEAATYTTDNFADTSIPEVVKRVDGNFNIIIHQGYFPQSAGTFHEMVALVNMDADLYNPTKAGLEFFYPLLAPGGIILVHDYNYKWPGILKAVDDFVATIPENLLLLPDISGTVMIIRNK